MDALGCVISAGLCLGVLVIFGVIGRIVDGALADVRYTIAPGVVNGVRAWEASRRAPGGAVAGSRPDDPAGGPDHPGAELVVAVGRVRPTVRAAGLRRAVVVAA